MGAPPQSERSAFAERLVGCLARGLIAVDAAGAVAACNDEARRILDLGPRAVALGRPARAMLADWPALAELLLDALAGRDLPLSGESALLAPDGDRILRIAFDLGDVRDADGRTVGAALLFRGLEPGARSQRRPRAHGGDDPLVARSGAMRDALAVAARAAEGPSTVLLLGETGTGKERVAEWIHRRSPRSAGPFVELNCAALPETLLESELFGHERGAFTGADRRRIGRFEQARGGTLFLDEIGEASLSTQAKLLRVLQEGEFHRLGGVESLASDARIVAATHRDLARAIREGRFREDLFYRLDVVSVQLPPLRERPDDARALAERFLARFGRELGLPRRHFDPEALDAIARHPWPGNVRELRNAVERAVLMADDERIGPGDLGVRPKAELADASGLQAGSDTVVRLADAERAAVLAALRRADFVQKEAARLLGVSRRKLNYMIGRLGITHPSWRRHRGRGPSEEPRAGS